MFKRGVTGMKGKNMKSQSASAVRASISFPPDIYKTLEDIARQKKVSLAWVVREAAEQYIGDKWPLFNLKAGEQEWKKEARN
jgi:predicted transcriptional regulator